MKQTLWLILCLSAQTARRSLLKIFIYCVRPENAASCSQIQVPQGTIPFPNAVLQTPSTP